jgi:hypothetical protein
MAAFSKKLQLYEKKRKISSSFMVLHKNNAASEKF